MLAAAALDIFHNAVSFNKQQLFVLSVGFIVSFLVATATVKFLLFFIKRRSFILFGFYRIAIAVLFWLSLK